LDLQEAKTYFHEFYEIGPLTDVTSIRSYLVQNSYMDSSVPHGPRTYMTDFAYQIPSVDLLTFTADKVTEYRGKIGHDYRPCAIFYETYPFDHVTKFPADSSAYANRGRHFNCTVQLRWAGSQHDEWVKSWIKDFVRDAREIDKRVMLAEGRDPTPERGYATFHLPGDRAEKAFGGNLERLKEVKRKWDPNGRFNKWLNIPI
jgi:Berberine and berberine like